MRRFSFAGLSLLATVALNVACTTEPDASTPPPTEDAQTGTCPVPTKGPTTHAAGDIAGSETWTADASPHIVTGQVNVRGNAKLVIEPCAVVQLGDAAGITVDALEGTPGELVAEGTADKPIRFEGADGARWDRVLVRAPATARFAHTTFENGGGGDSEAHETLGATADGTLPRKEILFVDHVTIKGSRGAGARVDRGAAFMTGSRDLVITGSGANDEGHPYPLEVNELSVDGVPTGTYTGNARDEILLQPEVLSGDHGFQQDTTIRDRGVPYHVGSVAETDHLSVGNGNLDAVLTIEAGVKVLFEKKTALFVESDDDGQSAIRALGTADKPVVFGSASKTPAAGDWRGLYFNGPVSAQNQLSNIRIEHAGADCACSMVSCSAVDEYEAAIIFSMPPTKMFLEGSVIAHSAGHGVVQGYDGNAFDWSATNTFEDVAGCNVTLPRNADTSCPGEPPACK